jgi:branched-chain amino acid transport system ATP-binding protein
VLLMDEPFLGLAPVVIDRLIEAIRSLQQELGLSLLIVEQNPRALELATEVMVMRLGEIALREPASASLESDAGMIRLERAMVH